MSIRQFLIASVAIIGFALFPAAGLRAEQWYGWVHGHYHGPPPYYICNPKSVDPNQAAMAAYPNGPVPGAHQSEPCPRAYPYGYFGAQAHQYTVWHRNYYNDFTQWSYRRGY
jgi:hypothetical protein